ncbi:unnamed protein product, partial [Didymodactylos carnosus]
NQTVNILEGKLLLFDKKMKSILLVVLLFVVTVFGLPTTLLSASLDQPWNLFKQLYGKVYTSTEEETDRRKIWEKNLEKIRKHNLEADLDLYSYKMGVNKFTDWTHDEVVRKMIGGFRPELRTTSNNNHDHHTFLPPSDIRIPAEVDWRKEGYVTEVKDELQCGSCWAMTATGALEGQHFKKYKKLISLSEQNLIDCSGAQGNQGCNGGLMDQAFEYIRINKGIDTEKSYPYEGKDGKCRFKRENVGANDTGYVDIKQGSESDLQIAIATIGPISVAMDASHPSFINYKSGVLDEPDCSSENLGHSAVIVGYGTTDKKKDYYIVKNSWGTAWGNEGYILMSRNKNNQCGIATMSSYPLV